MTDGDLYDDGLDQRWMNPDLPFLPPEEEQEQAIIGTNAAEVERGKLLDERDATRPLIPAEVRDAGGNLVGSLIPAVHTIRPEE